MNNHCKYMKAYMCIVVEETNIAQLVERCTGIAEVMGLNPVRP